jgi:cell wall-associated NlpC family hydrolase
MYKYHIYTDQFLSLFLNIFIMGYFRFVFSVRFVVFICGLCFLIFSTSCGTTHSKSHNSRYSSAHKRNQSHKKKTSGYLVSTKKDKKAATSGIRKEKSKLSTSTVISSERQDIVNFALKFKGTRYKYSGKSPDSGFDCSGFASYVFKSHGVDISGPSHQMARLGKEKNMSQLMPGDLVFFGKSHKISHVAIVAENRDNQIYVVHATTSAGVKMDNITQSEYWKGIFLFGRDILAE